MEKMNEMFNALLTEIYDLRKSFNKYLADNRDEIEFYDALSNVSYYLDNALSEMIKIKENFDIEDDDLEKKYAGFADCLGLFRFYYDSVEKQKEIKDYISKCHNNGGKV